MGAGQFGSNHIRVVAAHPGTELVAVVDRDLERARIASQDRSCVALTDFQDLAGLADCAIVATPTSSHAGIASGLMALGVDVLVEKPIALDLASAARMVDAAREHERILQIGHLERFNPAVMALEQIARLPLFFEIHRMSLFSPRSLDVDVVLDLMIHDLDIVLALAGSELEEIRAAGISILSGKVDIANVRLQFRNGCVANLTASRASTEKIRKLRLFQPGEYISVDYSRQELLAVRVTGDREISFHPVETTKDEPLRLQLDAFLDCVRYRTAPKLDGMTAMRTLETALAVLAKIEEHSALVQSTIRAQCR